MHFNSLEASTVEDQIFSVFSLFVSPDIPDTRPRPVYVTATRNNENVYSTKIPYMAARVVFIKWLVTFFLEKKYLTAVQHTKNGGEMLPKIIQVCFEVYLFSLWMCQKPCR